MNIKVINPTERPRFNEMHGHKMQCHCQLRPSLAWEKWCQNGFFVDTPKEVFVMQSRINARSLKMLEYDLRKNIYKILKGDLC